MKKEYPANKRYTQSEFVKIARELGWTVTESRGKGIGVDQAIKKALGLK